MAVCVEPFWPWAELQDPGSTYSLASVYGYNSLAGMIPGAAFLTLWLTLVASGGGWPRGRHSALLLTAGLVVVLSTAVVLSFTGTIFVEANDATVRLLGKSLPVGYIGGPGAFYAKAHLWPYVVLGLGLALLFLGCLLIRPATSHEHPGRAAPTSFTPRASETRGLLRNPLAWAFVLCLVGVVVCFEPFWPWMELELDTPQGSRGDFAYGYQFAAGLIPGIALLALWFALLASGLRRPRWWHSALLLVVGMVVVLPPAVMLFFAGSARRNLTTMALGFVTYDSIFGVLYTKLYAWPYIVVGLGLALIFLGCLLIRQATSNDHRGTVA
jgi:hypothetical protein